MSIKNKKRPFSFIFKIIAIPVLLCLNLGVITFTASMIYEEIVWGDRLSVPNMCEWDLSDGDYQSMYDTLWLYRETGEETQRFWRIACAYEDMIDCITYRQAAKLGIEALQGFDYAKLAEEALSEINEAKAEAELEQDKLVLDYFMAETEEDFPVWPQNK